MHSWLWLIFFLNNTFFFAFTFVQLKFKRILLNKILLKCSKKLFFYPQTWSHLSSVPSPHLFTALSSSLFLLLSLCVTLPRISCGHTWLSAVLCVRVCACACMCSLRLSQEEMTRERLKLCLVIMKGWSNEEIWIQWNVRDRRDVEERDGEGRGGEQERKNNWSGRKTEIKPLKRHPSEVKPFFPHEVNQASDRLKLTNVTFEFSFCC